MLIAEGANATIRDFYLSWIVHHSCSTCKWLHNGFLTIFFIGGRDPRGIDARGMEARAMEARGLDARGLEARAMEARAMEARAMEARAMEARAMEVRGMEARGMDTRGPVPGPRGPIPSGMQGPSPINMGAVVPQGSRQVCVTLTSGIQVKS